MKKCESCRYYEKYGDTFEKGTCSKRMREEPMSCEMVMPITIAREHCDKEGDGHFVYFEQKVEAPDKTPSVYDELNERDAQAYANSRIGV